MRVSSVDLIRAVRGPILLIALGLSLMFGVMRLILFLAPLGAGAAIAFTIGKFGLRSLVPFFKRGARQRAVASYPKAASVGGSEPYAC